MANFFDTVIGLLKEDKRFFTEEGALLRNRVYEAAMNMDAKLIKSLLGNAETKARFFIEVEKTLVFDKVAFGWVVNNREFLPDSYTRFKNKIGLTDSNDNFISASNNVVLSFPYKDCILVGGQTKEDQRRDEVFLNETLAPSEVDRLLYPKVLVNAKRYTGKGIEEKVNFSDKDNLIIKGNNLLAISSLLKRYEGRVKCIYIDPPYNTGNDSFKYNDRFSRSTWLSFMRSRLEIAKRLLSSDGSIFVHLDYNESHYFKVLMDEIFTEENFKNEIIWRRKQATSFGSKKFGIVTDSIFYYGKSDSTLFNTTYTLDDDHTQKYIKERFIFKEANGDLYMKSPLVNSLYRPNLKYVFQGINPPKNGWLYSQQKMQEFFDNGELIIPDDPNARIYRKIYLKTYPGQEIQNLWTDIPIVNPMADEQVDFQTQKPEKLLQRIISTSTEKGDIVLDFCLGSGTTAVVAHKMDRQYIGIEQMDYLNTVAIGRLVDVLRGDTAGISKIVNWRGGGSFVYCELANSNQTFADAVAKASTNKEVMDILKQVLKTGFISSRVNPAEINASASELAEFTLEENKRLVIELLDKNMLYVNLCDMEDEDYKISPEDKAFTKSFYNEEKE